MPDAGSRGIDTTRVEANISAMLVLGMHRSGTSALARVLNLMGAYVGESEDLMPPHAQDNPTGYWERRELVIAHDDFFETAGHAWDRVSGFDLKALDADLQRKLARRVRQVVANQASHGTPWLVKDPRLCLLLPIWLEAAPDAACIVVVRDPREIAASMRESHRGIYTSHFLLALWEKYLRCAMRSLTGRRVVFVSYRIFLADPASETERLHRSLETLGVAGLHAPAAQDVASFLDKNLHRSAALKHASLSPAQHDLFAWLQRQCAAPGPVIVTDVPDGIDPDAELREFERTISDNTARARADALGETARRLAQLETAIAEQQARLLEELSQSRRDLSVLREQISRTAVHVTNLEHRNRAVSAEAEGYRQRADRLSEELHAQAQQHNSENAQQRAELDRIHVEQHLLQQHANALEQRVNALRGSLSWKITAPLRGLVDLLTLRLSWNFERTLYRLYYAIPGISDERKQKLIERLHRHNSWLTKHTVSYKMHAQVQELREQRLTDPAAQRQMHRLDQSGADALLTNMHNPPLISIIMPVYNVEKRWLLAAVDSVQRQFYPHWELCIADDASTRDETRYTLGQLAASGDKRIKIRRLERNVGIAAASNAALDLASGDYIGLLDNDDELSRDALTEVAQCISAEGADFLYSDEDKLDDLGRHVEPHFKPDYSPDYFLTNNYICHFSVVRRELLNKAGGFREGFDGAQDFDLFLRVAEHADRIAHIPKVLYHWRKIAGSTAAAASAKPKSTEAGRRAVAESLDRQGVSARVEFGPFPNTFNTRRVLREQPRVNIIVPFRDKPDLLKTCMNSILSKSSYQNFEIIGVDNNSQDVETRETIHELQRSDSRVRFLRFDAPFNYSAINNFAARNTDGEHLLLLNNDTEVLTSDWIEAMLEHSQRPEVGAVGAKLLYPDGTLQHAGVVIGLGGVAGHPHLFLPADHPGYFARAQLTQNMSAVTFACAMTRRQVFEQLGGLNEQDLTIAFNDVDYCLRAREAGYLIVYTPNAVLYHHESKSRGYEDNPEKQKRFAAETAYIQRRHAETLKKGDPYYNPNLSLLHAFVPADDYVARLPS